PRPGQRSEGARPGAPRLKVTETDAIRNVISALMSSAQLAPNFWIDPSTGNPYVIGVQYPEYAVENIQTLENIPISAEGTRRGARVPLLKEVARIERTQGPIEVYHHDVDRVSQVFVNVGDNDLAGVAAEVERIVRHLPVDYAMANLVVTKAGLGKDQGLRRQLEAYLLEGRQEARDEIREHYRINPDQL